VLAVKLWVAYAIPDIPDKVAEEKARLEFLRREALKVSACFLKVLNFIVEPTALYFCLIVTESSLSVFLCYSSAPKENMCTAAFHQYFVAKCILFSVALLHF